MIERCPWLSSLLTAVDGISLLTLFNNISTCVTNRGLHVVDKDRAVLVTPQACTLLVPFVHRDSTICAQIE